jgi:hypothetical protein
MHVIGTLVLLLKGAMYSEISQTLLSCQMDYGVLLVEAAKNGHVGDASSVYQQRAFRPLFENKGFHARFFCKHIVSICSSAPS